MSSSEGDFPLPLLAPIRTPSHQHHLLSPVKPVAPHFAERKRDGLQAFVYDEDLHQMGNLLEKDFLNFLGVDEAILNVEPPSAEVTGEQPTGRNQASGKKVGGKKVSADGNAKGTADASKFNHENFLRAANTLAKSMKEKRVYLVSL
jgi:hypothetical protein